MLEVKLFPPDGGESGYKSFFLGTVTKIRERLQKFGNGYKNGSRNIGTRFFYCRESVRKHSK